MEFFLEKIIRFSKSKAGKIPFAILENILCKVLFFNKNKLYNILINYFQLFSNGKIFSNFRKKKYFLLDKLEKDNSFNAVMCVGAFTFGHVKPHAFDEFIRITKNKGLICFTINEGIYEEYGFDKKIKELSDNNHWKMKEFFKSDYIASKSVNAWLGIAEVIK